MKIKGCEQGMCPYCGSHNLEYDSAQFEDNMLYYPWTCEDCEQEGEEWYNLNFTGHNITNKDGEEIILEKGSDYNAEI